MCYTNVPTKILLLIDNTYYIPICIWLMDTHPHNAPMCFVKPTPTMHIKVSMYVDHNGKIYLPYLHDWQPVGIVKRQYNYIFNLGFTFFLFQHTSDLLSLIQVMILTFGDHPPVFSKPRDPLSYSQAGKLFEIYTKSKCVLGLYCSISHSWRWRLSPLSFC